MAGERVELNIPLGLKDEPFFHYISRNFEVVVNIIEASFSTDVGWAIVEFEGDDQELQKLYDFLQKKGVKITFR